MGRQVSVGGLEPDVGPDRGRGRPGDAGPRPWTERALGVAACTAGGCRGQVVLGLGEDKR